jgi:hypothetical protein
MPGFAPQCPKCHSEKVKKAGRHDYYPLGESRLNSEPTHTTFCYVCECGLAFSFDVRHRSYPPTIAPELKPGRGRKLCANPKCRKVMPSRELTCPHCSAPQIFTRIITAKNKEKASRAGLSGSSPPIPNPPKQ